MESALDWMKKFDMKYRKTLKSENNIPSTTHSAPASVKSSSSPMSKGMDDQKTLKSFLSGKPIISHQSELFDDTFNQADFALVTRRWKDKNTENVVAK